MRIFNLDANETAKAEVRVFALSGTEALASKTFTLFAPRPSENGAKGFPNWAGVAYFDLHAEFPAIPDGAYRIEIVPQTPAGFRTWALATVTNNATQLVTAIAPQ